MGNVRWGPKRERYSSLRHESQEKVLTLEALLAKTTLGHYFGWEELELLHGQDLINNGKAFGLSLIGESMGSDHRLAQIKLSSLMYRSWRLSGCG